MKTLVLLISALMLLATPAKAVKNLGAFFTLVNAYIYPERGNEISKLLIGPRLAFDVIDLAFEDSRILYLIEYPEKSMVVEGEGWTPVPPHQFIRSKGQQVQVFSALLGESRPPVAVRAIPVEELELLNESQPSEVFPEIIWHKVRYKQTVPMTAWISSNYGIYRPGKKAHTVANAHSIMVARNIDRARRIRLLSGVVQLGDTTREVEWALGPPLRRQVQAISSGDRSIWVYPAMEVAFENNLVIQLN